LAARSASRRSGDYTAHAAAVALNAFVYYLFASVKLDPVVNEGVMTKLGMPKAFAAASVIVAVFAGVFLWFSSAYFMKRRKREAGLYALFGAPRPAVAFGLFAETAAMGLAGAFLGVACGVLFSRLFLMAAFRLVGVAAAAGPSGFVNLAAVGETVAVFAALLGIASVGAFLVVYRYRLSELFGAAREAERMPRSSPVLAAASAALLAAGYWIALTSTMRTVGSRFFLVSAITTVATYGLARFLAPAAARALRADRRFFMRSWRPIAIGNLAFRIGNNVRVFFAIAMVGTVSMVAIGTGLNVKYDTLRRVESEFPFSFAFDELDGTELARATAAVEADGRHPVIASASARYLSVEATIAAGKGEAETSSTVELVSVSEYVAARLASGSSFDRPEPREGEAMVVLTRTDRLAEAMGARVSIAGTSGLVVAGAVRGSPIGGWAERAVLLLSDADFERAVEANPGGLKVRRGLKVADDRNARELSAAVADALPGARLSSFEADVRPLLRSDDLFLFIGVFIGVVFLASTGSVIHFKHVMEASDDAARFRFLSTIGAERAVLEKAVRAQAFVVYLVPLALCVSHSVVALSTMGRVFQSDFTRPIALTVAAYCAAYSALFLITSRAAVNAALGRIAAKAEAAG